MADKKEDKEKTEKEIRIEKDKKTDKILPIGIMSSNEEIRQIQMKINEIIHVMKIK